MRVLCRFIAHLVWLTVVLATFTATNEAAAQAFTLSPNGADGPGVCAQNGIVCLRATTVAERQGGMGFTLSGSPRLVIKPTPSQTLTFTLGNGELSVGTDGLNISAPLGFRGFGPLDGWSFDGPSATLALGLGSSHALDSYNDSGFAIGRTTVRKQSSWLYFYASYTATFSVTTPGGQALSYSPASGNTVLVAVDLATPEQFAFYLGGGFTELVSRGIVSSGYVLVSNGASIAPLPSLDVLSEFPGNSTLSGSLQPTLMLGGEAQLGTRAIPIVASADLAMRLDSQQPQNSEIRAEATLNMDLGAYGIGTSIPLANAGFYASRDYTIIRVERPPVNILAGTPLAQFAPSSNGYRLDAYISGQSAVVQLRADSVSLGGLRLGSIKVGFVGPVPARGAIIGVEADLNFAAATYHMSGSMTLGRDPQLRLANTGALSLFGQTLGDGMLEVTAGLSGASLRVRGNVNVSSVRFRLDKTFDTEQLRNAIDSIPLDPMSFTSNLTSGANGRSFSLGLSGRAEATLSTRAAPTCSLSGTATASAPTIRLCAPEVCAPQVCTPRTCAPEVCAPPVCTPRVCAPQVCAPRVCTPRVCTPRVCVPRRCVLGVCTGGCTGGDCTGGQCTGGQCTPGACTGGDCARPVCTPGACTEARCVPGACTPGACTETPAFSERSAFSGTLSRNGTLTVNPPGPVGDVSFRIQFTEGPRITMEARPPSVRTGAPRRPAAQ